jgi:hypothetical protein
VRKEPQAVPLEGPKKARTFTVAEANATLPLVRAIVGDLVALAREVTDRRQRLALLTGGRARPSKEKDLYQEELGQIEQELESDTLRLQGYVEELHQLGVEPKSATEGLVDFPTLIDGRSAYLCWKLGEEEVLHWHEFDAGFRGRQRISDER